MKLLPLVSIALYLQMFLLSRWTWSDAFATRTTTFSTARRPFLVVGRNRCTHGSFSPGTRGIDCVVSTMRCHCRIRRRRRRRRRIAASITTMAAATAAAIGTDSDGDIKDSPQSSRRSQSVQSFKVMDVLRRANELQSSGMEVLHCEVGQPETGAPMVVSDAAVAALTSGPPREVLGYTDAFGLWALREKISDHYAAKYVHCNGNGNGSSSSNGNGSSSSNGNGNDDVNVGGDDVAGVSGIVDRIDPSRIVVTTGSSGGFLLAFTSCFDVGDVVAVASSGYPCYRNILGALGCTVATIPINSEFKLTAAELEAEIQRRKVEGLSPVKGLILSSPSNPTGAMLTPHEVEALCRLCNEENIQFISDEIYHGISYGKEEATALSYSSNAIVINSFSKYYSMSGWRLGWMILPESLVDSVNRLQQNMFINAPTISQTAALKCWDDESTAELETHVAKYRSSRDIILAELHDISELDSNNIAPADGGFYVYVDLGNNNVAQESNLGSVAMCRALLEEEYVAFTPGTDFEDPNDSILGDRRFRISYAGGIDTCRRAMERFRRFWPTWIARVEAARR